MNKKISGVSEETCRENMRNAKNGFLNYMTHLEGVKGDY
jgi:hypothetical protein